MLTRKKILLTVILAALTVRSVFAIAFSQSFFANYHLVPGLDMQTLLRFSEWQAGNETAPFSPSTVSGSFLCGSSMGKAIVYGLPLSFKPCLARRVVPPPPIWY